MSLPLKSIAFEYMSTSASIRMFSVKGVPIATIAIVFFVYSLYKKNKKLQTISIIVLFLSYIYTVYTFINVETLIDSMEVLEKEHFQIKEGIIFYTLSYIILLISLFIPSKKDSTVDTKIEEMTSNIKGQYILANYVFGIEKRPDLYRKISALATTEDIDYLEVIIDMENPTKIQIPKSKIKNIESKTSMIGEAVSSTSNYGMAENIRDTILFGPVVGSTIMLIKGDKIKEYNKIQNKIIYEITLTYENDKNEEKKFMFQSKENPSKFLELFQNNHNI